MPITNANTVLYATRMARYPAVNIASGTAANTITLVATGDAAGSLLTDLLFRNAQTTGINFDIIICATGSQATAENARLMMQVPGNSGNNGTVAVASLAAISPQLFDIDLAGNRVLNLEAGQSIYVRNIAATTSVIFVTAKLRDYSA